MRKNAKVHEKIQKFHNGYYESIYNGYNVSVIVVTRQQTIWLSDLINVNMNIFERLESFSRMK